MLELELKEEIERMEASGDFYLHYKVDERWYTVHFWYPREGVLLYRVWIPYTGWSRPFRSLREYHPDQKEIHLLLYSLGEPVSAPRL